MKTPTINAAIERVMRFHLPIITMLLGVSGAGCIPNPRLAPGLLAGEFVRPPLVRVRLADTSATYIIRSEGRFLIRGFRNDSSPSNYSTTGPIQAGFNAQNKIDIQDDGGVQLDTSLSGIWVHPADSANRMWINDKPFYGALIIGRNARGKSRLVNRLNLDVYLTGVLTPELGERSAEEFEAVKAQAIASRTYALSHLGQYIGSSYDLRADVGDQVYVGASQYRDWVDRAVFATRGEVLTHDHQMINAYYHSTCGGYTDAIEDVWGNRPTPYLKSVYDDSSCGWSKYSEWTETFDEKALLANLRAYRKQLKSPPIPDFQQIRNIWLEGQTPGSRLRSMTIVTPEGKWTVRADKIRWALGRPSRPGTILPSAQFKLDLKRGDDGRVIGAVATGSGYGHGVGMCQCGMIGRARAGEHYEDILLHYYLGARVETVY